MQDPEKSGAPFTGKGKGRTHGCREQEVWVPVPKPRWRVWLWASSWISAGLHLLIYLAREENGSFLMALPMPPFYDSLMFQAYSTFCHGGNFDNRPHKRIWREHFLWLQENLEHNDSYNCPLQSQIGSKEIKTGVWDIWLSKQIEFSKPGRDILRLEVLFSLFD